MLPVLLMKRWKLVQWNKHEAPSGEQSLNSQPQVHSQPPTSAIGMVWEAPSLWPSAPDNVISLGGKRNSSYGADITPFLLTPRRQQRGAKVSLPRDRVLRREVMLVPHPWQEPEGAWPGP